MAWCHARWADQESMMRKKQKYGEEKSIGLQVRVTDATTNPPVEETDESEIETTS